MIGMDLTPSKGLAIEGETLLGIGDCTDKHVIAPKGVRVLGQKAFMKSALVEEIVLPEGLEIISKNALSYCPNLKKVTLPSSLKEIEPMAFIGDPSFEGIALPPLVKKIPAMCFCRCEMLKSVTLGVCESIGVNAFMDCQSLVKIHLPDSLKLIDSNAFSSCKSLQSVSLPKGIETIEACAFAGCSNLRKIEYRGSKEEWLDRAHWALAWLFMSGIEAVVCEDGELLLSH